MDEIFLGDLKKIRLCFCGRGRSMAGVGEGERERPLLLVVYFLNA